MKHIAGFACSLLLTGVVVTSCGNNSTTATTTTTDSMQKDTAQHLPAKPGITSADWGESDGKK